MAGLALESHHRAAVPGPHGDWLYTFARSAPPQTATAKVHVAQIPYHVEACMSLPGDGPVIAARARVPGQADADAMLEYDQQSARH